MGRKIIGYAFGAIALYLVVYYSAGFASDEKAAANGGAGLVDAFEGR